MIQFRIAAPPDLVCAKLDKFLIEDSFGFSRSLGYIGCVDSCTRRFWVADHTQLLRTRTGLKYYNYRRFCASIRRDGNDSLVEGRFKLMPLYWLTLCLFGIFIGGIALLLLLSQAPFIELIKPFSALIALALGAAGVTYFNIYRSLEREQALVKMLEDYLNTTESSKID
ncbi:hypothetical protein ACR6HW_14565 [Fusibacter sp. JL298sf-3]